MSTLQVGALVKYDQPEESGWCDYWRGLPVRVASVHGSCFTHGTCLAHHNASHAQVVETPAEPTHALNAVCLLDGCQEHGTHAAPRVSQAGGPARWDPKWLREGLCKQQTYAPDQSTRAQIGLLIACLDQHRPLGPDGKHGDRHTATCGCDL